jgi:hypothetical protein
MTYRKKTSKTLSNPTPRVSTRKPIAKVLDDYVDASFSESEPPHLHNIPLPPIQNSSKRDNQTKRERPTKFSKKSNRDYSYQEMHLSAGKIFILLKKLLFFHVMINCFLSTSCNVSGPIFHKGQQTSQDTELWLFVDRKIFRVMKNRCQLVLGPYKLQKQLKKLLFITII